MVHLQGSCSYKQYIRKANGIASIITTIHPTFSISNSTRCNPAIVSSLEHVQQTIRTNSIIITLLQYYILPFRHHRPNPGYPLDPHLRNHLQGNDIAKVRLNDTSIFNLEDDEFSAYQRHGPSLNPRRWRPQFPPRYSSRSSRLWRNRPKPVFDSIAPLSISFPPVKESIGQWKWAKSKYRKSWKCASS